MTYRFLFPTGILRLHGPFSQKFLHSLIKPLSSKVQILRLATDEWLPGTGSLGEILSYTLTHHRSVRATSWGHAWECDGDREIAPFRISTHLNKTGLHLVRTRSFFFQLIVIPSFLPFFTTFSFDFPSESSVNTVSSVSLVLLILYMSIINPVRISSFLKIILLHRVE